jgi:FAD-dependent urate hydroxylase
VTVSTCQVAIVGAGPYGLAAAAHMRSAGVETRIFGEAMEFWQHQMPNGMLLRSSCEVSHIADSRHALTLNEYQSQRGSVWNEVILMIQGVAEIRPGITGGACRL